MKGFTLIELLVVVLIIGILAAVAVPQYTKAVEKARLSEAMVRINAMEKAAHLLMLQNGGMPRGVVLGKNATLESDIDLTGGLTCSNLNGSCYSKHFDYQLDCDGTQCYWRANRWKDPASNTELMVELGGIITQADTSWSPANTWYRYCYWEDELGRSLCTPLGEQGWDVAEGF